MKLFSIRNPESVENSEYMVLADDHQQAAELYVQNIFDEGISVDEEELADQGSLEVTKLGDVAGGARILAWEDMDKQTVELADIKAWGQIAERDGFEL